jgi:ubiquitin-like 1-activating enzyme E1 B
LAFEKVFNKDVRNLLSMEDMWRTRAPPTPLDFSAIRAGTFDLGAAMKRRKDTAALTIPGPKGSSATEAVLQNGPTGSNGKVDAAKLKDQRVLGLEETVDLFSSA